MIVPAARGRSTPGGSVTRPPGVSFLASGPRNPPSALVSEVFAFPRALPLMSTDRVALVERALDEYLKGASPALVKLAPARTLLSLERVAR